MPSVYKSNRKEEDSSNGISSNGLSDHEKRALNMFSLRNDSGEKLYLNAAMNTGFLIGKTKS